MRVANHLKRGWSTRLWWLAGALLACGLSSTAAAAQETATLNPAVLPRVDAATFEVVAAKPAHDPLTYAKPLPMDLLPYQERTDKYHSIGTAFAIGPNRYVTAGHVLLAGLNSLWGPLELRDAKGRVYTIGKIEKFSLRKDFVVFSLASPPRRAGTLATDTHPAINSQVYAVGNALGTGVVIRGGLYTSDTPENQDGAWKWIRFSAAASPGNSGGPLLDGRGRVIGVVLMKSANENLNYALPISEILKAPANMAVIDARGGYGFPLIEDTRTGTFKARFKLPMTLAGFYAAYRNQLHAYVDGQLKALLAENASTMFPRGDGSTQLLYAASRYSSFPALLTRQGSGNWQLAVRAGAKFQLPDNGYLRMGSSGSHTRAVLFHLRKPDNLPLAKLYADPSELSGLLLKAGFLTRNIASAKIRITSLGKPTRHLVHTDAWQRPWQVNVWSLPFANGMFVVCALPVPDGYVGFMSGMPAKDEYDHLINLEAMTDYFYAAYSGTLAQWQAFLQQAPLLPAAFKGIRIGIDYDKRFSYASNRLTFNVTPKLQKVDADSQLDLWFSFFRDHGKVVWDVSGVQLLANAHDDNGVAVVRYPDAAGDTDEDYANTWKEVLHRQPPFDGGPTIDDDVMKIAGVVGATAAGKPAVLYTARYQIEGQHSQGFMKQKLDELVKGMQVHEH